MPVFFYQRNTGRHDCCYGILMCIYVIVKQRLSFYPVPAFDGLQ